MMPTPSKRSMDRMDTPSTSPLMILAHLSVDSRFMLDIVPVFRLKIRNFSLKNNDLYA